ncbi:MAG: methanogenesis marker 9 domain-containing protein [Promethearchaeota archaeon]
MMLNLKQDKLRDIPGWEKNAPIPLCMGGDYRALTFCCKPGYSLTFGFKCQRDKALKELGISTEEFIKIKEKFSKDNNWDSEIVCFGSISYCCMRRGGCPRRDVALAARYPNMTKEEFMKIYFKKKKELSRIILQSIKDPKGKEKVKFLLDLF